MYKLTIFIIFSLIKTLKINYYFERQSTLNGDDFLHLYIDQNNINEKKIVYKIPKKFRNKEVFKMKICHKKTISIINTLLEQNPEVDLTEYYNYYCLEDEYNTINVIEFEERILLKQVPIYNLYKICSFGYAYAEAEKAFLSLSFNSLLLNDRIQKEGIFFRDIGKIQEIFEESHLKYYRKELNDNSDFHCKLDFQDDLQDFNYEGFGDIFFYERKNLDSVFIIEYDLNTNYAPIKPYKTEFYTQEMETQNKIDLRERVLKSLEKDFIFEKKSFEKTELKIHFENNSDQNEENENLDEDFYYQRVNNNLEQNQRDLTEQQINLKIKLGNDIEGKIEFPIKLEDNTYLRFYPIICYQGVLTNVSYEFVTDCIPLSDQNILLFREGSNYKFIYSV